MLKCSTFWYSFGYVETGTNYPRGSLKEHQGTPTTRKGQDHRHLQTIQKDQGNLGGDGQSHQRNRKEVSQTRRTSPQQRTH